MRLRMSHIFKLNDTAFCVTSSFGALLVDLIYKFVCDLLTLLRTKNGKDFNRRSRRYKAEYTKIVVQGAALTLLCAFAREARVRSLATAVHWHWLTQPTT